MPSLLPTRPDGNRRSHRSVYLGKPTRSTNRSALESQERRLNRPKHTPNCRTRGFDCHGIGNLHGHSFTIADVPLSAFSFAHELGQEWVARLHRAYPAEAA